MRRPIAATALAAIIATSAACSGAAQVPPPAPGGTRVTSSSTSSPVAATPPGPGTPPAAADPSCDEALTPSEIESLIGIGPWTLTDSDDVMPDTDITCQWDFKPDSPEWLHVEVHLWSGDQAARFLTGGLPGEAVSDVGDAAAWDPFGRLLVQLDDRVLGVVPGSWFGDIGVRDGAIAMAALVVPRIPR